MYARVASPLWRRLFKEPLARGFLKDISWYKNIWPIDIGAEKVKTRQDLMINVALGLSTIYVFFLKGYFKLVAKRNRYAH